MLVVDLYFKRSPLEYIKESVSFKHNITEESFLQNGVAPGGNSYTFDTNEKQFRGLNIDPSPLIFDNYNVTSITVIDQNGTVLSEQTGTFDYDPDYCNRAVEEVRTINGSAVTFSFSYQIAIDF